MSEDSGSSFLAFAVLAIIGLAVFGGYSLYKQSNEPDKSAEKTVLASPTPPPPRACATDHRFERLEVYPMNLRADIALDSCTGKICRTWNWETTANSPVGWKNHANDPLCSDLSISNP